jgi:hypothetical protein
MMTLLGALLGFFSSAFPDILRFARDKQDRAHELAVLQLQIEQQANGHTQKVEEIRLSNAMIEAQTLYQTYNTGIIWVDALNGTVRPIIAYAFFMLYAFLKLVTYASLHGDFGSIPLGVLYAALWTEEDAAIFAGIISFYFGQRAMGKCEHGRELGIKKAELSLRFFSDVCTSLSWLLSGRLQPICREHQPDHTPDADLRSDLRGPLLEQQ